MEQLLLSVGNIYIDHNVLGIDGGVGFKLQSGKDYFAESGERVLGGSAINVAIQLRRLGMAVGFVGKTGSDAGAEEVNTLLDEQGILRDLMCEDANQTTSMAVNLIDTAGEFIGLHYGKASRTLTAADINVDHELFTQAQAIYFGGTAKQPLLFNDCVALFQTLSERGIKVFYDPNRFPAQEAVMDRSLLHTQLAYVEGYFPNESELLQATDMTSIDEALDQVLASGVHFVALKLGAKGCRIKTAKDDFVVGAKSVNVISTVGAGDCFNATFIANYLKGKTLHECAEYATAAAAIKVSQNIWPDETMIRQTS